MDILLMLYPDRTGERYFHIVLPLIFAVIAFIIAATTDKIGPRYLAMMLMLPGVYSGYVVGLAWISNSLPRPPAKRAAALAFINAISNTSSIYASYMYYKSAGRDHTYDPWYERLLTFGGYSPKICSCDVCQLCHVRYSDNRSHGIEIHSYPFEQETGPGQYALTRSIFFYPISTRSSTCTNHATGNFCRRCHQRRHFNKRWEEGVQIQGLNDEIPDSKLYNIVTNHASITYIFNAT